MNYLIGESKIKDLIYFKTTLIAISCFYLPIQSSKFLHKR